MDTKNIIAKEWFRITLETHEETLQKEIAWLEKELAELKESPTNLNARFILDHATYIVRSVAAITALNQAAAVTLDSKIV